MKVSISYDHNSKGDIRDGLLLLTLLRKNGHDVTAGELVRPDREVIISVSQKLLCHQLTQHLSRIPQISIEAHESKLLTQHLMEGGTFNSYMKSKTVQKALSNARVTKLTKVLVVPEEPHRYREAAKRVVFEKSSETKGLTSEITTSILPVGLLFGAMLAAYMLK